MFAIVRCRISCHLRAVTVGRYVRGFVVRSVQRGHTRFGQLSSARRHRLNSHSCWQAPASDQDELLG
jgi:hypothetical protein